MPAPSFIPAAPPPPPLAAPALFSQRLVCLICVGICFVCAAWRPPIPESFLSFFLSFFLSAHLSSCLSLYLSVRPPLCLSACLSVISHGYQKPIAPCTVMKLSKSFLKPRVQYRPENSCVLLFGRLKKSKNVEWECHEPNRTKSSIKGRKRKLTSRA